MSATSLDTISRRYRGESYSALNAIQRKLEAATARLAGTILHMVVLLAHKCTQTGAGYPAARRGPPLGQMTALPSRLSQLS